MLTYVMIGLGLWNLIVTAIYGLDKFFAMKEKQRISEFSLLFFAFCFAGLGALLGMDSYTFSCSMGDIFIGLCLFLFFLRDYLYWICVKGKASHERNGSALWF